ncbi:MULTISPECIES: flavodoxin domain-containing protein [unclassified Sulfitobacter]|uniref:flavodoxin domain-containing protein n=1 Tax=unclassified Sulfitobacter TaxID=196795 RepID=UPI0007C36093|nr:MULTISPECIES: flavodoxin domain-containing protein [unclassified Sulfitobacter]KZY02797.1 nitric oxide synthase [Sulfitobacter sp. HI0023]KZY25288.1 nitric oxide synthase [Sulfitobacter sp. HI0040]KZZ65778.1 nitric oxide synthase [Sulfitobacter sp. HI0129]
MNINVLYGTETGNAEMLAEDIAAELEANHEVTAINLSDFDPANFDADTLYLLVCSTYGDGELPASAQPFAEKLESEQPDLTGVHFGIFGMGDSEYEETFNGGPKTLAELMIARGASQLGDRIAHDASGTDMAEDIAFPWAEQIVGMADETIGQAA